MIWVHHQQVSFRSGNTWGFWIDPRRLAPTRALGLCYGRTRHICRILGAQKKHIWARTLGPGVQSPPPDLTVFLSIFWGRGWVMWERLAPADRFLPPGAAPAATILNPPITRLSVGNEIGCSGTSKAQGGRGQDKERETKAEGQLGPTQGKMGGFKGAESMPLPPSLTPHTADPVVEIKGEATCQRGVFSFLRA